MTRKLAWLFLGIFSFALTTPLWAMIAAPAPIPDRVATADMVVIGKITSIEEKTIQASRFPGSPVKTEFRVAMIHIETMLKGPKGLTDVRLGFIPPPPGRQPGQPPQPKPGQPVPFKPGNRFLEMNHVVGQEACFFLSKPAEGDFLVATMYYNVIDKKSANFDKDIAQVKRCTKLLEDPKASLQSKDGDERLTTAAMLLAGYRNPVPTNPIQKTGPIDAAESALILKAIADGDWSKQINFQEVSPQTVFNRLNLTAKDGWNPPQFKDYQKEFPVAAQKWLKDNDQTYRIQKFVP
jgi:hypothetical protein